MEKKKYDDKQIFIEKWEKILNSLSKYDRRIYLKKLLKNYNDKSNTYNFSMDDIFYPIFGVGVGEENDETESLEWQEKNTWQADSRGEKIPFKYDECTDEWL